jgi:hypothetical protein
VAKSITRYAPPATVAGLSAAADYGFEKCYNMESGSLVDRTAEFQNGATPVVSFAAQNDYIYLGYKPTRVGADNSTTYDGRFLHVYIRMDTPASASIVPVFEYSSGDNAWTTLGMLSDTTVGFSADGTLTVSLATLPGYTTWIKATKDGSGNTIGDGVGRCYLRIKRTAASLVTPSKLIEVGTGELTASRAYYYCGNTLNGYLGGASSSHGTDDIHSAPCAEVSATTTAYKRCIKLTWTADGYYHMFWRAPASDQYHTSGYSNGVTTDIDITARQVSGRGGIFYRSTSEKTDSSLVDSGMGSGFTVYSAYSYILRIYYTAFMFRETERSTIYITGGTDVDPVTFKDIYDADIAGGWGVFLPISVRKQGSVSSFWPYGMTYDCRATLYLASGYLVDSSVSLQMRGTFLTGSGAYLTLGQYLSFTALDGSTQSFPRLGCTIDFVLGWLENWTISFYNAKLYNVDINPVGVSSTEMLSQITFLGSYTELRNVTFGRKANMRWDTIYFTSSATILDSVTLTGNRWGLDMASAAWAGTLTDLVLVENRGIRASEIPAGSVTFRNFRFEYITSALQIVYLGSANKDKVLDEYFINPDLSKAYTGQGFSKAWGGINYTIYEQYELGLTVRDEAGSALAGATVLLVDSAGNTVLDTTTDANGAIPLTACTWKQYKAGTVQSAGYYSYYMDSVTSYPWHRLTVSKAGYETEQLQFPMSAAVVMPVTLKRALPVMLSNRGPALRLNPANLGADRELLLMP